MNGNNGIHGEAIRSSLANKGATGGESMSQGSSKGIRCAGDTLSAPDRIANAPSRHHRGHTVQSQTICIVLISKGVGLRITIVLVLVFSLTLVCSNFVPWEIFDATPGLVFRHRGGPTGPMAQLWSDYE